MLCIPPLLSIISRWKIVTCAVLAVFTFAACTETQETENLSVHNEIPSTNQLANPFDYVGKQHNKYARHLLKNYRAELLLRVEDPAAYITFMQDVIQNDFNQTVDLGSIIDKNTGEVNFLFSHT